MVISIAEKKLKNLLKTLALFYKIGYNMQVLRSRNEIH